MPMLSNVAPSSGCVHQERSALIKETLLRVMQYCHVDIHMAISSPVSTSLKSCARPLCSCLEGGSSKWPAQSMQPLLVTKVFPSIKL
eukprot:scaffold114679_cov18-Tisochrysis_lutea.AAC.2